jgi:hypothetical protein
MSDFRFPPVNPETLSNANKDAVDAVAAYLGRRWVPSGRTPVVQVSVETRANTSQISREDSGRIERLVISPDGLMVESRVKGSENSDSRITFKPAHNIDVAGWDAGALHHWTTDSPMRLLAQRKPIEYVGPSYLQGLFMGFRAALGGALATRC